MSIALDLIVILIMVFTILRSIKTGFITTLFDAGKLICSIIIAIILKGRFSEYIMSTEIFVNAKENVMSTLIDRISAVGENINTEDMLVSFEENNPAIVKLISGFGGSIQEMSEWVESAALKSTDNIAELAAQYIIEPAARVISGVISFAIIFIVAFLLLCIVQKILNLIFQLPLLRQINKLAGALLGIVCSFLYVSIFCFVATVIIENIALFGIEIPQNLVEDTDVFSFFSDSRLIPLMRAFFK